jgi:hypothetical protein
VLRHSRNLEAASEACHVQCSRGLELCCRICCGVLQAQRAEVDSGVLLDELQQLMQAKADAAQQHADLNRWGGSSGSSAWLLVG